MQRKLTHNRHQQAKAIALQAAMVDMAVTAACVFAFFAFYFAA